MVIMLIIMLLILFIGYVIFTVLHIWATIASFVFALLFGVTWKRRKDKIKNDATNVCLCLFLCYSIIGAGLVIEPAVKYAIVFVYDWTTYIPYIKTSRMIEETEEEIKESHTITIDGTKYFHRRDTIISSDVSLNDILIPFANIPDCTNTMIYGVKNDAGVTILRYDRSNYLSEEDWSKALAYYSELSKPHTVYCNSLYDKKREIKLDIELFNKIYNEYMQEARCEPGIPSNKIGRRTDFYIYAVSPDGVSSRKVEFAYGDSPSAIYFATYSTAYEITSVEARDAILPYAEKYIRYARDD